MENDNIVTSQPIEANKIKFRSKFASKIPESLEIKHLIQAVSLVNSMSTEEALDTLWQLTYQAENVLRKLNMTTDLSVIENDDLPFEGPLLIPEELIPSFRNELRYQRTLVDKKFAQIAVSQRCEEAFNSLTNATDTIVSAVVFKTCQNRVRYFDEVSFSRCVFLLKSPLDNNCFGGIRTLGFNAEEANYLKRYAAYISALVSSLWEETKTLLRASSPFACLAQYMENLDSSNQDEQVNILPDEESFTEESNTEPTSMSEHSCEELTFASVLTHKEMFETFVNACNKIMDCGFKPEEVFSKLDAISKILEAYKVLG